jgi:hypothetical protein
VISRHLRSVGFFLKLSAADQNLNSEIQGERIEFRAGRSMQKWAEDKSKECAWGKLEPTLHASSTPP